MSAGLQLDVDGAELRPAAVAAALPAPEAAIAGLDRGRAGIRLAGNTALRPLLSASGPVGSLAAQELGIGARPVRAILFDKSSARNWSLGWHQDRTICVKERVETAGFGPWSIKRGLIHVEPPFNLLAGMLTVRVHLDDVPVDNAPLLIAPGSHRQGRVAEADIGSVVARCGTHACLATAGDVWLYATPILHTSAASGRPLARRVLQVDYAIDQLPAPLEWLGV